jgi:hypothetical protein
LPDLLDIARLVLLASGFAIAAFLALIFVYIALRVGTLAVLRSYSDWRKERPKGNV